MLLLLTALCQLASGTWIHLKAELAQVLIAGVWQKGSRARPWPWADTWPVARLFFPGTGQDFYVLEDSGGQGLAFGPVRMFQGQGYSDTSPMVIAGHRDTHFSQLDALQSGDQILLQPLRGRTRRFAVAGSRILDIRKDSLIAREGQLLLVTCYPFNSRHAGGPLRYVVNALPQFIPD